MDASAAAALNQLDLRSRYVLLAAMVPNRHVLDFGGLCPTGLLAWTEVGAASLTVASGRAAELVASLETLGLPDVAVVSFAEALEEVPAAFDLILCHDLDGRLDGQTELLAGLRRILAPGGILVAAVSMPNGEHLGQLGGAAATSAHRMEALRARLSPSFGAISLVGQSPLLGSLFYDLDDDEDPDLSLDRSSMPESEVPGDVLLFCGPTPLALGALSLVQMPLAWATTALAEQLQTVTLLRHGQAGLQRQLAQHTATVARLEARLAAATAPQTLTEEATLAHAGNEKPRDLLGPEFGLGRQPTLTYPELMEISEPSIKPAVVHEFEDLLAGVVAVPPVAR